MLDVGYLPLRNDRAVLRVMNHGDAAAYAAGTADPRVREFAHMPEPEYTEASVSALIDGTIREGLTRGDLAVLTIADPETDEFVGSLVLFNVVAGSAEVGLWVHPDRRGQGSARAALSLASALVQRSGLTRLTARTVPQNSAAQRMLERAGFARGTEARDMAPSGETVILLQYSREIRLSTLLPLATERLRLRLHEPGDQTWLRAIYSQPEVARYLLVAPWSAVDAVKEISKRLVRTGLDDDAKALALVVERDSVPIGDVVLWLVDADRRVAEIGWALDPRHRGHGYAREAVSAVLRVAFDHYRLHRVAAQMDARNRPSAKLAAAVGMQREAHLRQDWWSKDEWTDTVIYGMLASDEFTQP